MIPLNASSTPDRRSAGAASVLISSGRAEGPVRPMPGSFMLYTGKQQPLRPPLLCKDEYSFENLNILSNYSSGKSWFVAENSAYMLLLDGHLYLQDAPTVDAGANLDRLLHSISVTTIDKGLAKIAGGIFSLIVLDKQLKRLVICGDRLGAMPLYYSTTGGRFSLSGNQFNFRHLPLLDFVAVEFLKYGYLPFSPSFFEDVRRLLPGQRLLVSLESGAVTSEAPRVFQFKPLKYRTRSLQEAGEQVHQAFSRYFNRFADNHFCMVPGRGDMSLLLPWMERFNPVLYHLPSLDSGEVRQTLQIARQLKLPVEMADFSTAALLNQADRLPELYRISGSLEHLPVLAIRQAMAEAGQVCYLDAFMSDAVISNAIAAAEQERKRGGFGGEGHNNPIRSIDYYQTLLYNSPDALPDADLEGILFPEFEVWFLNSARGILEVNRLAGHVHEDFIESLNNYTLHRGVRSMLSISLMQSVMSLCPFADYGIMQAFYDTDRSLRQDHIFYAHYRDTFFPGMASLYKGTAQGSKGKKGGKISRKVKRLQAALGNPATEPLKKRINVLQHLEKAGLVAQHLDHPSPLLPAFIPQQIKRRHQQDKLPVRLMLRYISLNSYLNGRLNDPDIS